MKRKYHFILTLGTRNPSKVVFILNDTATKQTKYIAVIVDNKYKSADILTNRDTIIAEDLLSKSGHDPGATIRLQAAIDKAEEMFFTNGTYYEQVANDQDLADLAANLGYELRVKTKYEKADIEVRNTLISGILLIILLASETLFAFRSARVLKPITIALEATAKLISDSLIPPIAA